MKPTCSRLILPTSVYAALNFFHSLTVDCQEGNIALDVVFACQCICIFIPLISMVFLLEIISDPNTMAHIFIF